MPKRRSGHSKNGNEITMPQSRTGRQPDKAKNQILIGSIVFVPSQNPSGQLSFVYIQGSQLSKTSIYDVMFYVFWIWPPRLDSKRPSSESRALRREYIHAALEILERRTNILGARCESFETLGTHTHARVCARLYACQTFVDRRACPAVLGVLNMKNSGCTRIVALTDLLWALFVVFINCIFI